MKLKDKIILILLSIFTIGIYPLVVFVKREKKVNETLSSDKKVSINLENLKAALGGVDNIAGCEYTHTKVKIFVKKRQDVKIEEVKNIKNISGVFASSNAITIIVGNQAKELAKLLI